MSVSRRDFLTGACAAGAAGMLAGRDGATAAEAPGSDPSPALAQKHDPYNFGQFAPPDAFENGSKLAYYGSENDWGPRQFTAETAEEHYKRLGQRHIYLIMQGHADQAIESCKAHIAKDPKDLESLFTLAVAQCQLGEIDNALATTKQSIAAGLPFERFLAGPRDLLAP